MIKILKWIWKKMIEIGNYVITAITIGSTTPNHIDVGDTQVWPETTPQTYYITLTPSIVTAWNGYERTDYINVDTNAPSFSVEASSSPASATPYFTAAKYGSNQIQWHMDKNTSRTSRVGYVTARYGEASAQTMIYQNAGYYIYVENTSPQVLSSGATTLAVSVISRYGNTAVPVSYQVGGSDWIRYSSMTDAGGGRYVYNFTVDANSQTETRHNSITFTQTLGEGSERLTATLAITQKAKYVPASISGLTALAYDGDWVLGRYFAGYVDAGQYGQQPMYGVAIVRTATTTTNYTATYEMDAHYGIPGPTNTQHYDTSATIAAGHTVPIPSGDTVYGMTITVSPNLYVSNYTFSVTQQ